MIAIGIVVAFVFAVLWYGTHLPRNGPMERGEFRGGDWYGEHDARTNPEAKR